MHPWDALQQKRERKRTMANKKKGDSLKGRERDARLGRVVVERKDCVCVCVMAKERKRRTPRMCYNGGKKKRKRMMARERRGDLIEGKMHACLGCGTIERRQRASTLRRK
jgi:hypothetical protein